MGSNGFKEISAGKRKIDILVSSGLGLMALVVYLLTLSRYVFPGISARYMAVFSGVEPSTLPVYPLWGAVVGLAAKLPVFSLAVRLNLLSVIFTVVSVVLLYRIVSFLIFEVITEEYSVEYAGRVSVFAGIVAAVAMMFSVPVWQAATQLRVESFNLMLALLMAYLLIVYAVRRWILLLALFAFLAGASIVQSAYFIPAVPVFLVFLIYILYKDRTLSMSRITWMGVVSLAGISLYFVFARSFYRNNDVELMGYGSIMEILVRVWRFQLDELRSGLARTGWTILLVTGIVPWVAAVSAAGRALNNERSWSQYLLHFTLTVFVVIDLTNATISPWGMLRPTGKLPVFSYVMIAMVAGYLVAYYYLLLKVKRDNRKAEARAATKRAGDWFGMIFTYPVAVIALLAAVINIFECKPNRGLFADKFAAEIIERMGERTWFITDGTLDEHLKILAFEQKRELNLIALQKDLDPYYLRSMERLIEEKKLFEGSDLVSMKSTLRLGILPFVQDWFSVEEDIASMAAVFGVPDFWYSAGLTPVPEFLFFSGCKDINVYKDKPVVEEYTAFWDEMLALLPEDNRQHEDRASEMARNLRRHLGFVANNLGVMLEDIERDDDAFAVYTRVHSDIDPENVSSMINRFEMARRGVKCADPYRNAIERELRDFVSGLKHRYPLWSLSRYYGYVRSPQIFAKLGYGWALSGQTRAALAGVNRAINLLPEKDRIANLNSLAAIYAMTDQSEESADVYNEIIRADPSNRHAMIGLGRLAVKEGAFKKASEWFEKAARAAESGEAHSGLEWAFVHLMNNDLDKARLALQQTTDLQPKNLNAWALLAHLQLQNNEVEEVETIVVPRMEKEAGTIDDYYVQLTRAMMNMKKAESDQRPERYLRVAREGFIRAARLNQTAVYLNDVILDLDIQLNDQDAALLHARQVLRKNRKHSLANYVMGSLRLREGSYGEAEDFLRRSVAAKPIYAALNDLAETLRRIKRLDDAEQFARDAVNMNPEQYIGWETLASVLVDAGTKLDEAESAVRKAVALNNEDLRVQITLARVLVKKGDVELAREVIRKVKSRQQELVPFEREELDKIAQEASK